MAQLILWTFMNHSSSGFQTDAWNLPCQQVSIPPPWCEEQIHHSQKPHHSPSNKLHPVADAPVRLMKSIPGWNWMTLQRHLLSSRCCCLAGRCQTPVTPYFFGRLERAMLIAFFRHLPRVWVTAVENLIIMVSNSFFFFDNVQWHDGNSWLHGQIAESPW